LFTLSDSVNKVLKFRTLVRPVLNGTKLGFGIGLNNFSTLVLCFDRNYFQEWPTVLLWLQRGNWTHYKGGTNKRYPQNSYKGGIFLHTYWYKLQRGNYRSMVRIFVIVSLPLTLAHLTYPFHQYIQIQLRMLMNHLSYC
jgi:hypothetical protein